jgi:hypothetical protein
MMPKKKRIFARLMAKELTPEQLLAVAGGARVAGGTCYGTISGSPRCVDDERAD